jgi:flagellar biosynthesis protein FlhF
MQVKTFKAATISLALDQVKKELGPNAIILGNKKVALSPDEFYIEVMAAVEPDAPVPSQPKPAAGQSSEMQNDIQEIKSFLSLLISSKDYFAQLQMQQPMAEVYHSLLLLGLDEKQTYILLKKAMAQLDDGPVEKERIAEEFCRQVLAKVKFARPFHNLSVAHRAPHVFTFLGPTGVGKTTTLAKLAAYLKIRRQLEVGLISADTYRIGAVDQLQTYAKILDIPLIVAQSKEELYQARDRFRHQDVILVDTIGKNYLNKHHVDDLRGIFDRCENIHHFLTLSATAKDGDLKQTIMHFRPMNINSLIFTKVDETLGHGSIINQLLRFPYPASYLGTGQKVPEDIELATQKRLMTFLFPTGSISSGKD